MKSPWDRRIARAETLSKSCPAAAELLYLYARLAAYQKIVFEDVASRRESDPTALARYFPGLIDLVERAGPPATAEFARAHLKTGIERENLLAAHWNDPSMDGDCGRFLARVLLQPFAESLAGRGSVTPDASSGSCPFCGARPVASALREEGEGGRRVLVCSLCSIEWEFRRILCANCCEENRDKLPVYTTSEFEYVRIEACDTCRTYLKSIDLTKNGLAVPVVDELASVPLNIWAEEQGYTKLEPNLLGL